MRKLKAWGGWQQDIENDLPRADVIWVPRFKICAKLSNSKVAFCKRVYEGLLYNDIIARLDEEEYMMRKLAGTLQEIDFDDN